MKAKAFMDIVVLFHEAKANSVVMILRVFIWASPNRVIEFACFDSQLQLARNTCGHSQVNKPSDANVCRALRRNTVRREAMRMNSVLPAVLFLAWSIHREAQQA